VDFGPLALSFEVALVATAIATVVGVVIGPSSPPPSVRSRSW
jgi:hypothetical protein